MKDEIVVSIICTTYNQVKYIGRAIDSFVAQKTLFKFEILIHDDASTDGTIDVVREYERKYPTLITALYEEENQYSKGVAPVKRLFEIAKGKYIAICEGDDFWIEESKLQKQVDFLEANEEYSLCAHAAYYANEIGELKKDKLFRPYEDNRTVSTEEILTGWLFPTNSLVYRRELWVDPIPYRQDCPNGDFATLVFLSLGGKIFYFDELWSAYRVNSVGSLNWKWAHDREAYRVSKLKFVAMLERIDDYTKGKYHDILLKRKQKELFVLAIQTGNVQQAKECKELYEQATFSSKIRLYLEHYIPNFMNFIRKVRRIRRK